MTDKKTYTLPVSIAALGLGASMAGYGVHYATVRPDPTPPPPPKLSVADLVELCTTKSSRRQVPIVLEQDLELKEPVTCTRPFILDGAGWTIRGGGIRLTRGAIRSSVRDLTLVGSGTGTAIDIEAHGIRLNNITVQNWETGIRAWSTGPSSPPRNANGQLWWGLVVEDCTTGIYFDGADANAGVVAGAETRNNGVHFYDSSLTGQLVLGGIADGHGVFHKVDSPSNYGTYVNAYQEGDPPEQDRMQMTGSQLVVGGAMGKWSSLHWGRMTVSGHPYSKLGFRTMAIPGLAGNMSVQIPGGPDSAMRIKHKDEGDVHWRFMQWYPAWRSYAHSLNGGGTVAIKITGNSHPAGPAHTEIRK